MATTPPCGGKAPLLTALLASALFALPACPQAGQGGPDAGARVLPVTVVPAAVRDVPVYLDGLGSVTAYNTVTVKTQVDGRLDQVFFKEGQPVKKGEVLAQIDPRPFVAQLHQAEGALARDQSLLISAQLDLTRYEKLVDQKLIPSQQFDQQKALVGQDLGLVQVDQAAVESARLNVGYARITSPVDGITGIRIVDPGNVVHATDQNGIILLGPTLPLGGNFETAVAPQLYPLILHAVQGEWNIDASMPSEFICSGSQPGAIQFSTPVCWIHNSPAAASLPRCSLPTTTGSGNGPPARSQSLSILGTTTNFSP